METININSLEIFKSPLYYYNSDIGSYVNNYAYISLVVTNNCQCSCPYCINSATDRRLNVPVEKALNNIGSLLKVIPEPDIILLGGEPTLHPQLFELVEGLRRFENIGTVRITTNGIMLKNNENFIQRLVDKEKGVEGINISFHNQDFMTYQDLEWVYKTIKKHNKDIKVRINSNVWKGNLDIVSDIKQHLSLLGESYDEIRISNIIPKDSFSVNKINEGQHLILETEEYKNLFKELMMDYSDKGFAIIENPDTLGFVKYYLIPTKRPIIINWNFDSRVSDQVCENRDRRINTFKCLVNGDISLSWNTKDTIY